MVALVNDPDSPLAEIASIVLPQGAGPEKSAAATKSFITSLSAIAQMVALVVGRCSDAGGAAATPLGIGAGVGGGLVALPRHAPGPPIISIRWGAGCIWQSRRKPRTS